MSRPWNSTYKLEKSPNSRGQAIHFPLTKNYSGIDRFLKGMGPWQSPTISQRNIGEIAMDFWRRKCAESQKDLAFDKCLQKMVNVFYSVESTSYMPWCAVFAWTVVNEAYKCLGKESSNIVPKESGNVARIYESLRKSAGSLFSSYPQVGDIFFRSKTGNAGSGHMGIVVDVSSKELVTIEGNILTDTVEGPERDGVGAWVYKRSLYQNADNQFRFFSVWKDLERFEPSHYHYRDGKCNARRSLPVVIDRVAGNINSKPEAVPVNTMAPAKDCTGESGILKSEMQKLFGSAYDEQSPEAIQKKKNICKNIVIPSISKNASKLQNIREVWENPNTRIAVYTDIFSREKTKSKAQYHGSAFSGTYQNSIADPGGHTGFGLFKIGNNIPVYVLDMNNPKSVALCFKQHKGQRVPAHFINTKSKPEARIFNDPTEMGGYEPASWKHFAYIPFGSDKGKLDATLLGGQPLTTNDLTVPDERGQRYYVSGAANGFVNLFTEFFKENPQYTKRISNFSLNGFSFKEMLRWMDAYAKNNPTKQYLPVIIYSNIPVRKRVPAGNDTLGMVLGLVTVAANILTAGASMPAFAALAPLAVGAKEVAGIGQAIRSGFQAVEMLRGNFSIQNVSVALASLSEMADMMAPEVAKGFREQVNEWGKSANVAIGSYLSYARNSIGDLVTKNGDLNISLHSAKQWFASNVGLSLNESTNFIESFSSVVNGYQGYDIRQFSKNVIDGSGYSGLNKVLTNAENIFSMQQASLKFTNSDAVNHIIGSIASSNTSDMFRNPTIGNIFSSAGSSIIRAIPNAEKIVEAVGKKRFQASVSSIEEQAALIGSVFGLLEDPCVYKPIQQEALTTKAYDFVRKGLPFPMPASIPDGDAECYKVIIEQDTGGEVLWCPDGYDIDSATGKLRCNTPQFGVDWEGGTPNQATGKRNQDGLLASCPPGSQLDTVTGACVKVKENNAGDSNGQSKDYGVVRNDRIGITSEQLVSVKNYITPCIYLKNGQYWFDPVKGDSIDVNQYSRVNSSLNINNVSGSKKLPLDVSSPFDSQPPLKVVNTPLPLPNRSFTSLKDAPIKAYKDQMGFYIVAGGKKQYIVDCLPVDSYKESVQFKFPCSNMREYGNGVQFLWNKQWLEAIKTNGGWIAQFKGKWYLIDVKTCRLQVPQDDNSSKEGGNGAAHKEEVDRLISINKKLIEDLESERLKKQEKIVEYVESPEDSVLRKRLVDLTSEKQQLESELLRIKSTVTNQDSSLYLRQIERLKEDNSRLQNQIAISKNSENELEGREKELRSLRESIKEYERKLKDCANERELTISNNPECTDCDLAKLPTYVEERKITRYGHSRMNVPDCGCDDCEC